MPTRALVYKIRHEDANRTASPTGSSTAWCFVDRSPLDGQEHPRLRAVLAEPLCGRSASPKCFWWSKANGWQHSKTQALPGLGGSECDVIFARPMLDVSLREVQTPSSSWTHMQEQGKLMTVEPLVLPEYVRQIIDLR
jgi:hypothetical protein